MATKTTENPKKDEKMPEKEIKDLIADPLKWFHRVVATVPTLVFVVIGNMVVAPAWSLPISGAITETAAPNRVLDLVGNFQIWLFPEKNQVTLANALAVDITRTGSYQREADLTKGNIPANTKVDSFFVHFSPPNMGPATQTMEQIGSITFDQIILGIMVLDGSLDASDPVVGLAGTTYPSNVIGRGPELFPLNDLRDVVLLSNDLRSISVDLRANGRFLNGYDELRIITAAVPEPSTSVLVSTSFLILLGYGFRRRIRTQGRMANQ